MNKEVKRVDPTRRTVVRAGASIALAAGGLAAVGCRASEPDADGASAPDEPAAKKRMLVLGGTVFLGPQIVRAALDAGWEVTLFNRGKSRPDAFPQLDRRVGDRNEGDYASLAEGTWDLVVDTSAYIPGHVAAAIAALGGADGGRIGHYLIVSTVSVYDEAREGAPTGAIDESFPVGTLTPEEVAGYARIQDVDGKGYGPLKALCESTATAALPGRVTVVRPGLIVGPEDGSDRYTYWPVRVARGGEILAPGDPDGIVQFVDVRDLGPWCFDVGRRRVTKTMNAQGFEERRTMKDVLESCVPEGAPAPTFTWASDAFLAQQGVGAYIEMPLWIPSASRREYSGDAAIAEGLRFRSLEDTAAATLAWAKAERPPEKKWRTGISPEREKELLDALRAGD